MLYYIKKYPLSLTILLAVLFLSFFKAPSVELNGISHLDKIAHVCMYFGLSGMLWIEFLREHRNGMLMWHAWVGAFIAPILFSGMVELAQEYCTTYRGGDWLDFAANVLGVVLASIIGYFVIRPWMGKRRRSVSYK